MAHSRSRRRSTSRDACAGRRHPLVRGAGHLGRSAGVAPDARTRARTDGHRRRRIHLYHATTRAACSRPTPSTCCRPTRPDAAALPGSLQIGALCEAHHIDLSAHCAPAMHRHVACAVPRLRHRRVVSRSRADRAHAVRRRAGARATARSNRISVGPVTASRSSDSDAERFRVNGAASMSRVECRARPDRQSGARRRRGRDCGAASSRRRAIAASPLIPKAKAAARGSAAPRICRARCRRAPSKADELARLISRYRPRSSGATSGTDAQRRAVVSTAAPPCWRSPCSPTARSSIIAARSRTAPCIRRSWPRR